MTMTLEDLAEDLLKHARWMVASGQFRGTAREYLTMLHDTPTRNRALRMAAQRREHDTANASAGAAEEEQDGDGPNGAPVG